MRQQNSFPLFQVDAFTTNKAFSGNPAAVCLLETPQDAAWMQAVAAEMNLNETAFVRPLDDGFKLRWFTPTVEVDLCGHATLAAAHVLWAQGIVRPGETISFQTLSGRLQAKPSGDWIELDFPEEPVTGSAHCALYPFWRERLNKSELTAYQASSRGGRVKLRGQGGRVALTGQTVTVMTGALHV